MILEKNPKCERALIDLFYITHDYSLLDKAIEANPNSYLAWLTKSLAWPHKISAIWRMKGVDIKRELFKDYQTELYSGI